jgi:hypothetical protein
VPVSTDIVRTYRAPRRVVREKLANGEREDRALATLIGACFLIFVSQWPLLSRQAYLDPSVPLDARMGGALMGWLFIAPLAAYVMAAASHLLARLRGAGHVVRGAARALLGASGGKPALAPQRAGRGLHRAGTGAEPRGLIAVGAFLVFWGAGLWEAERGEGARTA